MKTSNIIIALTMAVASIVLNNNCGRKTRPAALPENTAIQNSATKTSAANIDDLTKEQVVVPYVKRHGRLPDYYITKKEAREKGWIAAEGNLCDVLPGKAIGGDVFGNREASLPDKSGRTWYEADLNYNCGRRNADRLLFSSDGLIFVTYDHYKTFEKK